MLKIAVISDIHANLPALKAVLNDLQNRRADQLYCLGDLVDFAPWPNEVIDLIRRNRIPTLMGNHDERIAFDLPVVPLPKHGPLETQCRIAAIDYTRNAITTENKAFLATLPRHIQLTFGFSDRDIRLLLVHASPRSIDEYIYADHAWEDVAAMMAEKNADVLVMGHTHQSYIREIPGATLKTAINCGSVGRSKEADRRATYLLITVSDPTTAFGPDSLQFELIKVDYEIEETIEAIRQSPIPDFYADFLSAGEMVK
ncbi:metallophosphoesterase family protein [Larkinella terrae]|uniref:Metallophosphoesterase n=1 Tax=Larkinella terrae TaxID=2025311 RepID=A0A7K0EN71_9BACT|nr:metallophosphoesterase family protein [Larkinella terrae]MRS63239.1 metallophosphoesterase [Larkinella terrae]